MGYYSSYFKRVNIGNIIQLIYEMNIAIMQVAQFQQNDSNTTIFIESK